MKTKYLADFVLMHVDQDCVKVIWGVAEKPFCGSDNMQSKVRLRICLRGFVVALWSRALLMLERTTLEVPHCCASSLPPIFPVTFTKRSIHVMCRNDSKWQNKDPLFTLIVFVWLLDSFKLHLALEGTRATYLFFTDYLYMCQWQYEWDLTNT